MRPAPGLPARLVEAAPRQTEVEQLGLPVRRDHDVRGLQVAVHHVVIVRVRQRAGDLRPVARHGLRGQASGRDQGIEGAALHELHRDEGAAAGLADLVDRADVRVVQARGGARLAQQPLAGRGIVLRGGWQHLEGDLAIQPGVARPVDHTHAALAQLREDLVVGEHRPDQRIGGLGAHRSG